MTVSSQIFLMEYWGKYGSHEFWPGKLETKDGCLGFKIGYKLVIMN